MEKLSKDYHLRKYFLENNEVPTQSLIKHKMTPALAAVYFRSMSPKLKVLAGLEPPMKGGGGDWYVPPKDLLEGRAVLKPVNRKILSHLNCRGIDKIGTKLLELRLQRMKEDSKKASLESDEKWKNLIETEAERHKKHISQEAAKRNADRIRNAFHEFTALYATSLNKIENVLVEAARSEIIKIQNEAERSMRDKYNNLLKNQAVKLYEKYADQLKNDKERLKAEFIQKIEEERITMTEKLHDIKVEKRVVVEKVRQYLECQKLACQIYVALKEREECVKKIELLQHHHKKKIKKMTDDMLSKDFEITIQLEKEKKRTEFNEVWKKKVSHVVKKFQMLMTYCLNLLPEHADFFINTEKLMLLQLNEALDEPDVESIFVVEGEKYMGPEPMPRPYYLFCDRFEKTHVNTNLCPKHCTSSTSQLPVIVINKRCLYAACDTFEQFTNKIKYFLHGQRGDDADFIDDHIYEHYVPVKYTPSQELQELKLESSLLQMLQQERPNVGEISFCCVCKVPHCFCSPSQVSRVSVGDDEPAQQPLTPVKKKILSRNEELNHLREPKWQSYMDYIKPTKCTCAKSCKKHLMEHLPVYMRKESKFETAVIPNYETCSLTALKDIVKRARGRTTPPSSTTSVSTTRDIGTQYSDQEFDYLCTCFSDDEILRLFTDKITGSKLFDPLATCKQFRVMNDSVSTAHIIRRATSFAISRDRACSFKYLLDDAPGLDELFKFAGRAYD